MPGFFSDAPVDVVAIVLGYALHMNRVQEVQTAFLTCMNPFMADDDAAQDESYEEMRERAFMSAMIQVNPSFERLVSSDGAHELMQDLRFFSAWWVDNYIQHQIDIQQAINPVTITAQRMIMMVNKSAFLEWRGLIAQDHIPEAVDVVWNYNIIPEEIHSHRYEIVQRDYFNGVEVSLLTIAHRAHSLLLGTDGDQHP